MGTSSFKIFFPPQPLINLEEKLIWRNLLIFNKLFAFKKWRNNSPAFTITILLAEILGWYLTGKLVLHENFPQKYKSSWWCPTIRKQLLGGVCKKGVLKNFAKFTRKHLCWIFFYNKVAVPRPASLFKKRLWHRSLPVNFANFLRTLIL